MTVWVVLAGDTATPLFAGPPWNRQGESSSAALGRNVRLDRSGSGIIQFKKRGCQCLQAQVGQDLRAAPVPPDRNLGKTDAAAGRGRSYGVVQITGCAIAAVGRAGTVEAASSPVTPRLHD